MNSVCIIFARYPLYSIIICILPIFKTTSNTIFFKKSFWISPISCNYSLLDLHVLVTSGIHNILLHIIVMCMAYFLPLNCNLSEGRDIIFVSPAMNGLMIETLFSVC